MSIKNKSILLACCILGLLCAYGITAYQKPSPLVSHKLEGLPSKRTIAGKPNAMMEITIEPVNGVPENDEQEITLRASLTVNRPLDSDLNYKWILPNDVSVVSGHIEDGWNNILPGQTVTTEITLTGISKENPGKAAILHVESTSQGAKVGYSGVYAINPETILVPEEPTGKLNKLSKTKEEIISERLKGVQF